MSVYCDCAKTYAQAPVRVNHWNATTGFYKRQHWGHSSGDTSPSDRVAGNHGTGLAAALRGLISGI